MGSSGAGDLGTKVAGALECASCELGFDLIDNLLQRRAERVLDRFGEKVGAGRDKVRGDAERRAVFESPFNQDAGFVDLACFSDRFELVAEQRGE